MFDEIIKWTQELHGERQPNNFNETEYISPNIEKQILAYLTYTQNTLLLVHGNEGSGKTCFVRNLKKNLIEKNVIVFPILIGAESESSINTNYYDIENLPIISNRGLTIGELVDGLHLLQPYSEYDGLIKQKIERRPQDRLNEKTSNQPVDIILVEFSDFLDEKTVVRYLNELYHLWVNSTKIGKILCIILFLNTIIWEQIKHYSWFNKFILYHLRFTDTQLVDMYIIRFTTIDPFTSNSLMKIASLCEGNPRMFKRNIRKAIEYGIENDLQEITLEEVNEVFKSVEVDVTEKRVRSIFYDDDVIQTILQLIEFLKREGETWQGDLVNIFFKGNASNASKKLSRLKEADFIRVRKYKNRNYISIHPNLGNG